MISSLFIKTYPKDLPWLEWCFKFLALNWKVQSELVIGGSVECLHAIRSWNLLSVQLIEMGDWPDGYLSQQYFKMVSDLYCSGDPITFTDSDCMLLKPTTLEDLMEDGKPIIWYTPYNILGATVPWQAVTREVLGFEPEFEFMRCHPLTFYRSTLAACRIHLERIHKTSLDQIIVRRPIHSFSEFNVLGAYAYAFEQDRYSFKHTDHMGNWTRVRQFFSHDPVPQAYLTSLYARLALQPEKSVPFEDRMEQTAEGWWVIKDEKPVSGWVRSARRLDHDQYVLPIIWPHLKPGSLVIDCGAYIGTHTICYLDGVGPSGTVMAFEPHPVAFECLKRNCPRAVAFNCALGREEGTSFLWEDTNQLAGSHLSNAGDYPVQVKTIDAQLRLMNHPPLSFIKIDVEGSEPEVLLGAGEIIALYRPVIWLELNTVALGRQNHSSDSLKAILENLGYSWRFYPPESSWAGPQCDLLAIPQ